MSRVVSDPAFWLAVALWLVVLLVVLGWCVAAARADRMAERALSRRRDGA